MTRLLPLVLLAASACAPTAPSQTAGSENAMGNATPADSGWTLFTPYDSRALGAELSDAGLADVERTDARLAHEAQPTDDPTEVERAVRERVSAEGVHVVRLWAPWCGNSRAELEDDLYQTIGDHPDVTFSFVTIWNDGRDGAAMLSRYGITPTDDGRVTVTAQPDRGPSADRDLRRITFLGVPLSWTPTTLVYNRGGKLAYAFAYGEVSAEMLATAIADARNDWHHD